MKIILLLTALLAMTGCASYDDYLQAVVTVEDGRSQARIAEANAIAEIAKDADAGTRVAAVMSLRQSQDAGQSSLAVRAPVDWWDRGLQLLGIALPEGRMAYQSKQQRILGVEQVWANRDTTLGTVGAFVEMGSYVQAPAANVQTTTTTIDKSVGPYSGALSGNQGQIYQGDMDRINSDDDYSGDVTETAPTP